MTKAFRFIIVILVAVMMLGATAIAAPGPSEMKPAVVFLFAGPQGKLPPVGTAFFVGVDNPAFPGSYAVYMVTAKHVLRSAKANRFLDKVFVRFNRRDGKAGLEEVPLTVAGPGKNVFFHPDPSVDLAVIPYLPDQSLYDFKFLPDRMVAAADRFEELGFQEGADVFFTDLFTPGRDYEDSYPVMRFGRVALPPVANLAWQGEKAELSLIEAATYTGNSGSPLFSYFDVARAAGRTLESQPILKIVGIIRGPLAETPAGKASAASSGQLSRMGMTAAVPCYKLDELFHSDELTRDRGF